ncbi:MAG TPA: hypothetical protein VGH99_09330 [Pseudonocardia sp.]
MSGDQRPPAPSVGAEPDLSTLRRIFPVAMCGSSSVVEGPPFGGPVPCDVVRPVRIIAVTAGGVVPPDHERADLAAAR